MANLNESTNALKFQIKSFIQHIVSTYTSASTDVSDALVWVMEPFDITDFEGIKKMLSVQNYGFVISQCVLSPIVERPSGYLKNEFTANIYVLRRTLRVNDITNKTNLLITGGSDGASSKITSISKICGDMAKWFSNQSQGGKLLNGSTQNAFTCSIDSISDIQNTGDFYYKVCEFRALSMESRTISAT